MTRLIATLAFVQLLAGEEKRLPVYRSDVDLVVVPFSATDADGKPIRGLKPHDIRILEDGIEQRIESLTEGGAISGTSVYVLFDTSNRMYKLFPHVCDAIAEFVRRLNPADAVAIYTFSRNLSRAAPLTHDRIQARAGLGNAVAGDDTALFNSILLTLRDAAKTPPGRKAIVVFSNGPDNASVISPHDVGTVAVNEGVPIYIISTIDAGKDSGLAGALRSLAERTGGKLYLTRDWQEPAKAFASVREEIAGSYTASYYPAPNSNQGFRTIRVEVVPRGGKSCRVRSRTGYDVRKRTDPDRTSSTNGTPVHRPAAKN